MVVPWDDRNAGRCGVLFGVGIGIGVGAGSGRESTSSSRSVGHSCSRIPKPIATQIPTPTSKEAQKLTIGSPAPRFVARTQDGWIIRLGISSGRRIQKILDDAGIVRNEPIGELAHLGLGRAYAIAGDSAKARTAYQDFLA